MHEEMPTLNGAEATEKEREVELRAQDVLQSFVTATGDLSLPQSVSSSTSDLDV